MAKIIKHDDGLCVEFQTNQEAYDFAKELQDIYVEYDVDDNIFLLGTKIIEELAK